MTQWNDEQFDRVARWLDGEQIQLTDSERGLAEDFRNNDSAFGGAIDTPLPANADQRARRRVVAALRGVKVRKRVRLAFMSGVSAAAMIVISLGLINLMTTGSILADYDSLAWLFGDTEQSQEIWQMPEQDPELVLLAGDLAEIETALSTPEPMPVPIDEPMDEEHDGEIEELWRQWIEDPTGESETFHHMTSGDSREA
ncbi:MAG: hypothetical protein HN350_01695 [Phycisphaerales bacterium]|jgi:hypothetical protein|nr:hypothetical protein [Phycisphaerales bacterium]